MDGPPPPALETLGTLRGLLRARLRALVATTPADGALRSLLRGALGAGVAPQQLLLVALQECDRLVADGGVPRSRADDLMTATAEYCAAACRDAGRPLDLAADVRVLRDRAALARDQAASMRERAHALRDAFAAAVLASDDASWTATSHDRAARRAELKRAAGALAAHLWCEGATPEQMLVDVKGVLAEAAPAERGGTRDALTADVVRWAIDAYYAA